MLVLFLCGQYNPNLIALCLRQLVVQVQQSELVIILDAFAHHPLQKTGDGIVATVEGYAYFPDGHFRYYVVLQCGNDVVQRGVVG